jgi:hypothetical protein
MEVKSDVDEKPGTETDPTKPAPGAAAQDEKLKAEVVDENNNNEDEDVGESLKHTKPSPREYAAQPAAEAPTKERTDEDSKNSQGSQSREGN